jgi:hypothetical protein
VDEETTSSGLLQSRRWQAALWAGIGVLVAGIGVLGYAVGVADDVYPTGAGVDPYTTVVEQYRPGVARGFAAVCGVLAVAPVAWVLVAAWQGATGRSTAYLRPGFLVSVGVLLFAIGVFSFGHWVLVSEAPFPGDRALLVTSGYGFGLMGTVVVHAAATRMWSSPAAPRPCSRQTFAAFV